MMDKRMGEPDYEIMMTTQLHIHTPKDFHFAHTIYSHGWSALLPFSVTQSPTTLQTVLRLKTGNVLMRYTGDGQDKSLSLVSPSHKLTKGEVQEVIDATREMFSFDHDLTTFYQIARKIPEFLWVVKFKAGRMLRAQSFFEDVVKMILTTNCTWSLTTMMCRNLITFCSEKENPDAPFPTAEHIAQKSEKFLREKIKLGYRSPFIKALSERVCKGTLELESFRRSTAATKDLYTELRTIKGVGDYAASNLLKLLGRFDYLGLDSWCRQKFSELHANGKKVSDKKIERSYERFAEWKGLFMWLDLTREWYFDPPRWISLST